MRLIKAHSLVSIRRLRLYTVGVFLFSLNLQKEFNTIRTSSKLQEGKLEFKLLTMPFNLDERTGVWTGWCKIKKEASDKIYYV